VNHAASTTTTSTTRTRRILAVVLVVVAALVGAMVGRDPIAEVLGRQMTPTAKVTASANGNGQGGGNNGNGNGNGAGSNNGNGNGNAPFLITGQVTGLAPGVTRPLQLTLQNTQNFDIIVKTVTVTVGNSDRDGCSASNATATGFTGSLTVPKNGTAVLSSLSVRMIADPANACQGARFPLTYTGTAVKK
jgi:hypothetical protein